jgi:hypothetical protein
VVGSTSITPPGKWSITPGTLDLYFGQEVPVDGMTQDDADLLLATVHDRMNEMLESHPA